jgi:hypothetical protein
MNTTELVISPDDGAIHLSGYRLALRGGLNKEAVRKALATLFRQEQAMGNGYEWLSFHKVTFGRQTCGFAACFNRGALTEVHFSVSLPDAKLEDGWPTREAIEEELAFVRSQLNAQLGTAPDAASTAFPWGTVWSMFDPKGFQANSGVRYA